MKIAHIIPTFNERENIDRMIEEIIQIGKAHTKWRNEIIIIDDHSPDGTSDVVKEYQRKYPFIHLLLKKKEGLGKALIVGYDYAVKKLKVDVVVPNDADFQWNPADYPKLVKKIEEGYDVVVASRHIQGGGVEGWNWFRKLNHDVSNSLLAWFVSGVHEVKDHAGNFKAIRVRGVLEKVPLSKMKNSGFSFQLHILYELSKTGARFTEVPAVFRERRFGESKIGFNRYYLRDVIEYVRSSFLIRFDRNKRFFQYCVVGGIGFIIQTALSKLLIGFGIVPALAVSLGAEGAIISNFVANNSWTFGRHKITGAKIIQKFIQFNTVSAGAILIQGIVVGLGTHYFGNSTWFVFMVLAIVGIVIPYSYFIYNKFIWKTHT